MRYTSRGLRCGEVCALRWSDLGDDGTLTVNHAIGLDNGGVYLKDPKSASSHRTAASYLGHSNVALTLNTYAEVDPEAKRSAVGKIQDAFDVEDSPLFMQKPTNTFTVTFTVEQLEAMLEEAKTRNPSSKNDSSLNPLG